MQSDRGSDAFVFCLSVTGRTSPRYRSDSNETFGGGRGYGQERLSPEPALSVKVWTKKEWGIQIS